MSQKRNRSTNWDEKEKQLFRRLLKDYAPIIENKSLDTNSIRRKNKAWEEVHKKFNQLNSRSRELNQLKIRWKVMKGIARKAKRKPCSAFEKQIHDRETGGEARSLVTPSIAIMEIRDIMNPGELLRDHNINDSEDIVIGEISNETCSKFEDIKVEQNIDTNDDTNNETQEIANISIKIEKIEAIEDVNAQVAAHESTPSMMSQDSAPAETRTETLKERGIVQLNKRLIRKRNSNTTVEGILMPSKHQDDFANIMINHSKILKENEHERIMKMAEEEHAIKMKIHEEKLKSAVLEREILEIRKLRETASSEKN